MVKKYTKALLTNRNSVWGIIQNPHSENVYQHILSFDTQDLKDEFINRNLFPNKIKENPEFSYKEEIKTQSDKPVVRLSDVLGTYTCDLKTYPDETKESLMNKDFMILLEYEVDENGIDQNEVYTFWALSLEPTSSTPILKYKCELDIFFTYNINEMFLDYKVPIKRAMYKRFTEDKLPNVFNNINTYGEEFDNDFQRVHIVDKVIRDHVEQKSYCIVPSNYKGFKDSFSEGGTKFDLEWSFEEEDDWNVKYNKRATIPYMILSTRGEGEENQYDCSTLNLLQYTEEALNGIILLPIALEQEKLVFAQRKITTYDYGETPKTTSFRVEIPEVHNYGKQNFTITNYLEQNNDKDFLDLNAPYKWQNEGKIYRSPYYSIRIDDCKLNSYEIPFNYLSSTIKYSIQTVITDNMINNTIRLTDKIFNGNNQLYGISELYNFIGQKSVSPKSTYDAYHKSTYENQVKNANRHELQHKASGGIQIAEGIIGAITGVVADVATMGGAELVGMGVGTNGSIGKITGGAIEVANAKEEINGILATQQDLANSPPQQTQANTDFYSMWKWRSKYATYNSDTNKIFYSIKRFKPQDIVLEKLAWYFHLAGVNYAGTMEKLNNVIDTNYYYNYIQISASIFENMKIDLSSQQKQLIDASLQKGITIWHYRDKNTFKGVKQYDVNNVEMDILHGGD